MSVCQSCETANGAKKIETTAVLWEFKADDDVELHDFGAGFLNITQVLLFINNVFNYEIYWKRDIANAH